MNRERVGLFVTIFFEKKSKKDFHCYPSRKTYSSKKIAMWSCQLNSLFAGKLTTLEFNDKLTIYCAFASWCEKKVREDTNHGEN